MKRLLLFLTVCLAIFAYLSLRLIPGLGWWAGVFVAALIGALFLYPLLWKHKENKLTRGIRFLIHMDMGFLSFLSSFVVLRDLAFLPVAWLEPGLTPLIFGAGGSLAVIALSFVALAIGIMNARFGPRVREVRVPISALPAALEGYKIAHISDLHVGPSISRHYVERVVEIVHSLAPNMTVFTGDIADGHVEQYAKDIEPLQQVLGAHRFAWARHPSCTGSSLAEITRSAH